MEDGINRRRFFKVCGTFYVAGSALTALALEKSVLIETDIQSDLPVCQGYILVDTKKCQGCVTCMLSCSLAHEGGFNLSLSRIQVVQNSFARFPVDIDIAQCRQCVEPLCVRECPVQALHVDSANGNVRLVDIKKCIGCMTCVKSCAFTPSRSIWNFQEQHAQKCDLCLGAKFWKEKGGPAGKQACVEACPNKAVKFQRETPLQKGDAGYKVNLRGRAWKKLGFPID